MSETRNWDKNWSIAVISNNLLAASDLVEVCIRIWRTHQKSRWWEWAVRYEACGTKKRPHWWTLEPTGQDTTFCTYRVHSFIFSNCFIQSGLLWFICLLLYILTNRTKLDHSKISHACKKKRKKLWEGAGLIRIKNSPASTTLLGIF